MLPIRLVKFFTTFSISMLSPLLTAQPFVPTSEDFVVETLSSSIVTLSQELAHNRANADSSRDANRLNQTQLASLEQQALAAYRIAANTQEQRAYGHTLTILQRWPADQEKTATIHILLAAVLQHEHQFSEALSHLDAALVEAPLNAQAWLMQAQINLVIANYDAARESCNTLSNLVQPAVSINCLAQVDALTGNARRSLELVEILLNENRDLSRQDYAELFTSAAGFSQRLGQTEDAIRYYYAAWQVAPDHPYVLVNFAQLLLEQARYEDVITLFSPHDEQALSDEQKIILARALSMSEKTQDIEQAELLKINLAKSFEEAFKRQEALPNKAYAQFTLYLSKEPAKALSAARANWALQKEPSDTLLLALAAQANDAQSVLSVLKRWVDSQRTEDVRLDQVFARSEVVQ